MNTLAHRRLLFLAVAVFAAHVSGSTLPASSVPIPNHEYLPRLWQAEDGLPLNTVLAVTQTRDGYIWAGTRSGLARFDGVRFVMMLTDRPELKGKAIVGLAGDREGNLWIGIEGRGVLVWNGENLTQWHRTNGLGSDYLRTLCEARDGSMWFGTASGLSHFKKGDFSQFKTTDGLLNNNVLAVCEDNEGAVWAGTTEGLCCFRSNVLAATFTTQSGLPKNPVISLCASSRGGIWVGTQAGLTFIEQGRVHRVYHDHNGLPDHFINYLFEDRAGNLWIGTFGGLSLLPAEAAAGDKDKLDNRFRSQLNAEGTAFDQVNQITEDREGNIWIAGKDGLSRLRPRPVVTLTKQQGLTHNNVMSVMESRGDTFWVASWGGALNRVTDGRITQSPGVDGFATDLFLSMAESPDGSLWFGTDHEGGLYRLFQGRLSHYGPAEGLTNLIIMALYCDRQTNLWIGTPTSLTRFTDGHFTHYGTNSGLVDDSVRVILEDREGNIWIGTNDGLSKWRDGRFTNYREKDGLPGTVVLALYEDAVGDLWIGTVGGGLVRMRNGKFTAYTRQQGMFADSVFEILEDDHGFLWLSCFEGLFRVRKKDLDDFDAGKISTIRCAAYGKPEGMASVQCNGVAKPAGWKSHDGRLWFATTKGVAVADPEIPVNDLPPPVAIEELLADQKKVPMNAWKLAGSVADKVATASSSQPPPAIQIPPGRGELEIHFTALSLSAPEKNRFRYKLETADPDWVAAGARRVAYYNNLRPGKYRFLVQACNNDGLWSTAPAETAFVLAPHFWQTWWFIGIVAIAGVGSISGAAAYSEKIRSRRKLERLMQQHALERERARIAKDIHDDLGSSLTRIAMLSELAEADKAKPEEVQVHARKIAESARETVQSLDEVVWAVRPENDTWNSLVEYVSQYANAFFECTDIRCRLEMPLSLPPYHLSSEVRHSLFLIIKEALTNILKHSRATEVCVTVAEKPGEIEVTVSDNGVGFDVAKIPSGQGRDGMQNMRERAASIQGRFTLESAPGKGTRLIVTVALDSKLT